MTPRFLLFCLVYFLSQSDLLADDTLVSKANQTVKEFRRNIEQITNWCKKHHLETEARFAQSALLPQFSDKICIPRYPLKQATLAIEKGVPKKLPPHCTQYLTDKMPERPDVKWTDAQLVHSYLVFLREEMSNDLAALAKKACKQGRGTLAAQLAMAALHANPDNEKLRAAFGYVKYKDEWRSPWEVKKLKDGFVDHPQFGWIPSKLVGKYENGQRYYKGNWISVEEDAQFHSKMENAWVIESEFYRLATNHSIEGGVQLRRKLEHFYRAWRMLFFRFYATDEQLANYFSGNITPQIPEYRHLMRIYRNKEEFRRERKEDETVGGRYVGSERCCFFSFGNGDHVPFGMMFHEGTHQLFAEINGQKHRYGDSNNYWIVEGVADFMATFTIEQNYYTVGDRNMGRIWAAKKLWKDEKKLLPLSDLIEFNGTRKWTTEPYEDLGSLYNQTAGRFYYLMFADSGVYRDEMIVYLWMVYNKKDTANTFQQLFKMTPAECDRKYQNFLEE
ncbi:MAG: hypothetical protein LBQ50_14610 [Planctomycetaceae bacterium]|jgi:hypothetical protein|nr:hypothetical protein [Planctomycetaceae bacterium]